VVINDERAFEATRRAGTDWKGYTEILPGTNVVSRRRIVGANMGRGDVPAEVRRAILSEAVTFAHSWIAHTIS
jgi:hypothetical protein